VTCNSRPRRNKGEQLRNGHKKAQESTKTAAHMLGCMRFDFLCIFVFFVAIHRVCLQNPQSNVLRRKTQLRNGHKKAQESTKTAAHMLECMSFEFLCVFVSFVATTFCRVCVFGLSHIDYW